VQHGYWETVWVYFTISPLQAGNMREPRKPVKCTRQCIVFRLKEKVPARQNRHDIYDTVEVNEREILFQNYPYDTVSPKPFHSSS
jgi:hypothetical protein